MKSTQLCALSGAFGALFATAGGACSEFAMHAVAETHHDLVRTVVEVNCKEDRLVFDYYGDGSLLRVYVPMPIDLTGKEIVQVAQGKRPQYAEHTRHQDFKDYDMEWNLAGQWLIIDEQGTDYVHCGNISDGKDDLFETLRLTLIQ